MLDAINNKKDGLNVLEALQIILKQIQIQSSEDERELNCKAEKHKMLKQIRDLQEPASKLLKVNQ